ncbi:protein-glutamine gamma-glutamyltransferase 5-like [Lissotriton helveticus]
MAKALEFKSADFQIGTNGKAHSTHENNTKHLIVRRGQAFDISLQFNRGFQDDVDQLTFIMETGSGKKTKAPLSKQTSANNWGATVKSNKGNSLEVSLFTPANAIIGWYTLSLEINKNSAQELGDFIMLFNPWCSDDDVFLNNESQRFEYVLNENGTLFTGHSKYIQGRSWIYGQFEDGILEICLQLLDKSLNYRNNPSADVSNRSSPAYVSRVVSAMINVNDENGVVEGNWSGEYKNGKNPSDWNSSVAILRQWASSGFRGVKYGQCWVFASVLCTVLRCLGIPTRVVTNFESAHDTDGNMDVDIFYDKKGKELKEETRDSIWNFHVWNECWMARNDLPSGYSGWQVVDPTPQELSDGIFCCGPTPVRAIKEGKVDIKYDGRFVYAEVSANVISWVIEPKTSKKERADSNSRAVGQNISTKSVGSSAREDITSNYK